MRNHNPDVVYSVVPNTKFLSLYSEWGGVPKTPRIAHLDPPSKPKGAYSERSRDLNSYIMDIP